MPNGSPKKIRCIYLTDEIVAGIILYMNTVRLELIAKAEAALAAFPQYKGHFDNYRLIRIKRQVKTKMGIAFKAGELAICNPQFNTITEGKKAGTLTVMAFSFTNRCDTSVSTSDIEIVPIN